MFSKRSVSDKVLQQQAYGPRVIKPDSMELSALISGVYNNAHIDATSISPPKNDDDKYFCTLSNLLDNTTYVPYSLNAVPYVKYILDFFKIPINFMHYDELNRFIYNSFTTIRENFIKMKSYGSNLHSFNVMSLMYAILDIEMNKNNVCCGIHNTYLIKRQLLVKFGDEAKVTTTVLIQNSIDIECGMCMSLLMLKVLTMCCDDLMGERRDDVLSFYQIYSEEFSRQHKIIGTGLSPFMISQLLTSFSTGLGILVSSFRHTMQPADEVRDIELSFGVRLYNNLRTVDLASNTRFLTSIMKLAFPDTFDIKVTEYNNKSSKGQKNQITKKLLLEYIHTDAVDCYYDETIEDNIFASSYLNFLITVFYNIMLNRGITDIAVAKYKYDAPNCVVYDKKKLMAMFCVDDKVIPKNAPAKVVMASSAANGTRDCFLDVSVNLRAGTTKIGEKSKYYDEIVQVIGKMIAFGTRYSHCCVMNTMNDNRVSFSYNKCTMNESKLKVNMNDMQDHTNYSLRSGDIINIQRMLKLMNVTGPVTADVAVKWRSDGDVQNAASFTIQKL